MGALEEVQALRREGHQDSEIQSALREKGLSPQEIQAVMSQSKIKEAVHGEDETVGSQEMPEAPSATNPTTQEYGEMAPSMMSPSTSKYAPAPPAQEEQPQEESYSQQPAQEYQYDYSQQYAPSGVGSDVITEIADQVVAERLAPLTSNIDKIIDMRSSMDAQIRFMDERLKRIEKIIDRLQLSLLQRVGEYVSNVEDIKREMVETQKTFKALVDKK